MTRGNATCCSGCSDEHPEFFEKMLEFFKKVQKIYIYIYIYSTLSNNIEHPMLRCWTTYLIFFFSFSSVSPPILLLLCLLSSFFSCFVLPNHPLFSIFLSLFYVPSLICLWLLSLQVCDNFRLETVEVETF